MRQSRTSQDAAPAPTIGMSNPQPYSASATKQSRKRFSPFNPHIGFRSKSYNSTRESYIDGSSTGNDITRQDVLLPRSRPGTAATDRHVPPLLSQNTLRNVESARRKSSTSLKSQPHSLLNTSNRKASASTPTFFRLPRRKRPDLAFPLPVHVSPPDGFDAVHASHDSFSRPKSSALKRSPYSETLHPSDAGLPERDLSTNVRVSTTGDSSRPSYNSLDRRESSASANSSPAVTSPSYQARSRSGTLSSFPGRKDYEHGPLTFTHESGRNSEASTTVGRNSIVGLRSLTSRLRQPSEPRTPRRSSPGSRTPGTPHGHSFALSRETLVVPEREDGETSGKYYSRLETNIPKKSIALVLSKSADTFSHDVLRSLLRTFKFYEEPLDIALRRLLWEIDLPGEAQQIDRVMSAFAERYHECNPHIFNSFDDAFLIAYSLIILHSDLFNKNNKHKMLRFQYQKNTSGHGVPDEILGYFYDNIQYTEFIAQNPEDEDEDKKSKTAARRAKKLKAQPASSESSRHGKLDPYDVIIDSRLKFDILRPALNDELNMEDTYSYLGSTKKLDMSQLRIAFSRFGVLQLVSARSRPEAFSSPSTITNPNEAHPGVVNMKVAKVGILWRKDAKKKKGRSPWQEWGAVLTQSQLLFFRNTGWTKGLAHQAESHQKHNGKGTAVVFKPPLEDFKYDLKIPTSGAVALVDSNYKRHKHAIVFARRGDSSDEVASERYFEETLLAENEHEMNDWLAKLNYAAAFSTSNIRMQSWHPFSVAKQHPSPCSSGPQARSPTLSLTSQDEANATNQVKEIRRQLAIRKVGAAEDEISSESRSLEDHLKTARHLQILAPFNSKTRSDLLIYGARMSHNIRWSRFNLARLRCQRLILDSDLELDDIAAVGSGDPYQPLQPSTSQMSDPVTGSASSKIAPSMGSKSQGTASLDVSFEVSKSRALIEGIDKAFATPLETMNDFSPVREGRMKLLPISLDNNTAPVPKLEHSGTLDQTASRPSRSASTSSRDSQLQHSDARRRTSESSISVQSKHESEHPSTALETEKELVPTQSSSDQRTRARRSLQRTLREPREAPSLHHNRSRRAREPNAKTRAEVSPLRDGTGLARSPGSFTVHGKKASVITLGSEWQKVSAEERLRARKQAQSDPSRTQSWESTNPWNGTQNSLPHEVEGGNTNISTLSRSQESLLDRSVVAKPAADSEASGSETETFADAESSIGAT
ncbi:MAG: hypothetical protein M1828_001694 [Chrysothrix sp. TS-e1954]|nr:MAG: hypothetical protein M1828_001694 [Chrysothrix sp. TS-e1954]